MTGPNDTLIDELAEINLHAFIKKHGILTETGQPLSFAEYPYLISIYSDESPQLCSMKAAQIGFTTFEIIRSLFDSWRGDNGTALDTIYVLPTDDDVKQFSGGKTNRIIANNQVFQEWTKDKDSVEQKRVGKSTIYYRGSWTKNQALMISAKRLIVDEYDRCKKPIIEQYDSRLQFAKNPTRAYFSNPSLRGQGIDLIYEKSDKKVWHITHSCGETLPLDETCIDYQREEYVCPKCRGIITTEERKGGRWIPTQEGGEWSGYWIPLWLNPSIPASRIAKDKREKSEEYFSNFVAGLPYSGSGDTVTRETITNCMVQKTNEEEPVVVMGVDTGLPIHVVAANKNGIFWYGALSDPREKNPYLELEKLLNRWPRSVIIADQGGDLVGIRDLQARYMGRVFLTWYRRDARGQEMIKWGKDKEFGTVIADRNRLIQLFIDEMKEKRVVFNAPKGVKEWEEYLDHWNNIYRSWVPLPGEDENGRKEFRWERKGPDHFVHATIYARIGLDKYAQSMAQIGHGRILEGVPQGMMVQKPSPKEEQEIIQTFGLSPEEVDIYQVRL